MKAHLQRWFKGLPFSRTKGFERFLDRVVEMLKIPAPDTPQLLYRIRRMERDIILPIKAAGIAMLLSSFYHSPWIGMALGELDIAVESTQYFLWLYIGANAVVAGLLLAMDRLPPALLEERLRKRGTDSPATIQKRLSVARQEIAQWKNFDYLLISTTISEDLRRILAVIEAEKMRPARMEALEFE